MTLREMVDAIGIDEEPLQCAFVIAGLLRSTLQGEPATFEGECATLVQVAEKIGLPDCPETIRRWLEMLGAVPDLPVPDGLWLAIAAADRDEEN